jgi:hypothetical protein
VPDRDPNAPEPPGWWRPAVVASVLVLIAVVAALVVAAFLFQDYVHEVFSPVGGD